MTEIQRPEETESVKIAGENSRLMFSHSPWQQLLPPTSSIGETQATETPGVPPDTRQAKRGSKKVFRDFLGLYPKGGLSILFDRNKADEDSSETEKPNTTVWY